MRTRWALLLILGNWVGIAGDWSPKLAADYLDARQKAWIAWPTALHNGAPCVSCHTSLTYLMARPALTAALRENGPTTYQTVLLDSLRKGLGKSTLPATQALGTESVLAAFLLASHDARAGQLTAETEQALDRLWALQNPDGKNKGAWNWFSLELDPWEEPESAYFGASLAALAVWEAPGGYAARPEIGDHLASLKTFLLKDADQPLHNRLIEAWVSTKWPGLISAAERAVIAQATLAVQQPDGGWTIESLGPWHAHKDAPSAAGSNAYATALAAFALQQAGVSRSSPAIRRALDWLRAHQDAQTGAWSAASMNKRFEPGSMQIQFMSDAATSFAVLALLAGK